MVMSGRLLALVLMAALLTGCAGPASSSGSSRATAKAMAVGLEGL